nr:nucleolar protein 58-like [Misgurnus anguillicaudatus]
MGFDACKFYPLTFDQHALFVIVEEVKHQWKSLRDTYIRKKREDECKSGQAAKEKKPWKFMKVMEFLATSTEFRSVHSNVSDVNMGGVEVQNDVSDSEEATASTCSSSSIGSTSTGSSIASSPRESSSTSPSMTRSKSTKRKRSETPDFLERYLLSKETTENENEERKREKEERKREKEKRKREKEERRDQRKEQQKDDNYLFALGLVPTLRRLSPAQQSSVKLKIHQLLHDAEFGQSSSLFSNQSPVSYHQVTPQTPTNYGHSASTGPHC